jgi:peptide/nickel transport system permease protein
MHYLRYVLRRAAFAVASFYAVLTLAFLMGTAAIQSDIQNAIANARYRGASPAELARLERSLSATFGVDEPLLDRLFGWWIDVTTFDWGYSSAFDEPILAVLGGRAVTTLSYVLPGILLAVVLGVAAGLYAALRKNGAFDWATRLGSYLLLGVPAFMLAIYLTHLRNYEVTLLGGWYVVLPSLNALTIAMLAVAVGLLAGQLRFARASALEQTGESFVKMLRAKGAGRLRLARHVLRNAAIPIVSLSITELLAVLVLNIYVIERVLNIRGIARVSLRAVGVVEGGSFTPVMADVPLLMWSILIIVFLGITLSFLQDVLAGYLDPRIADD